jgi:hypothetical protein
VEEKLGGKAITAVLSTVLRVTCQQFSLVAQQLRPAATQNTQN